MALSDKVRQVAFTLAVGSIGAVVGYLANDVVRSIGKEKEESVAETKSLPLYVIQAYRSTSGIIYFDGGFAF